MKHIACRQCIVCKKSKPKNELFRIVEQADSFAIDANQKVNARAFYVCKDLSCINNITARRALSRYKKTNISQEKHIRLCELLLNEINK